MKNSYISIIAPVYNSEKYLATCIESVLAQTFPNFELLLIDDGSKDKSGAICEKYADIDTRIKVWHVKNGGPSRARNIGLGKSTGNYITFLDSDDYLSSDALEILYREMTTYELDILQFSHQRVDYEGNLVNKCVKTKESEVISSEEYIKSSYFEWTVWGSFIKREIIENNHLRFDESIKISEDTIFISEVISHSQRLKKISNKLYFYTFNENSLTNTYKASDLLASITGMLDMADRLPDFKPFVDPNEYRKIVDLIGYKDVPLSTIKELYNRIDIHNYKKYSAIAHLFYKISKINFVISFLTIRYIVAPLRTIKKFLLK